MSLKRVEALASFMNAIPSSTGPLRYLKKTEIRRLTGVYTNILNNVSVTIIEFHGNIVDPHTVKVDGNEIERGEIRR
jgi:pyruvate/2-oxoglutarate dehydrogenase complex dihydrolipoamide dehydrogenase (E3) component